MRFIKLVKFDIKNGIFKKYIALLIPILIGCILCMDLTIRIQRFESLEMIQSGKVSFGDAWLYIYGGMKEYVPSFSNPFQIPVVWILAILSVSVLTMNYAFDDMQGFGKQVLVRSHGRSVWWTSKCIWNISYTILYHLMVMMSGLILCRIYHIKISLDLHVDIIRTLFNTDTVTVLKDCSFLPIKIMILPILMSVGINLMQMTISLLTKPIFGFMLTSIIVVSSAYLMSSFMIGNYAMPFRYSWLLENGVSYQTGYLAAFLMIVLAYFIGLFRFQRYDILGKAE